MADFDDKTISESVTRCDDGKYRWRYDVNLFQSWGIFMLIWKLFFFIFLGIFVVTSLADLINWGVEKFVENLPFLGYFLIGMTVVVALGYLIYALIMGGKYCMIFEMDEDGILHRQIPKQAKKAKKIAGAAAAAGMAAGRLSAAGAGMNAARTEMYTEFAKVKKVRAYPRRNLIKVNQTLSHNQVYARKEDFEFVKTYILDRCSNAK